MGQQPETTRNSEDREKKDDIAGTLAVIFGAFAVVPAFFAGKMTYDAHVSNLREAEQKIGTPAQPGELTAEALNNSFFIAAVADAFENNKPLVIDLAAPELRGQLEDAVKKNREYKKGVSERGKILVEGALVFGGIGALSMIGYNAYKRRKKQQAAGNSPTPGNG